MVVFGKSKGDRGSYVQSKGNNIPPQVMFEILSPDNTYREMIAKYNFYQRYVWKNIIYMTQIQEINGLVTLE
jgi:Uma2 family endonuclease